MVLFRLDMQNKSLIAPIRCSRKGRRLRGRLERRAIRGDRAVRENPKNPEMLRVLRRPGPPSLLLQTVPRRRRRLFQPLPWPRALNDGQAARTECRKERAFRGMRRSDIMCSSTICLLLFLHDKRLSEEKRGVDHSPFFHLRPALPPAFPAHDG